MRKLRISVGPGDVAGYLGQLAHGFRELGVVCEHFVYTPPTQFAYPVPPYFLSGVYNRVARLRRFGGVGRALSFFGDKVIRMIALFYAIIRYDVFIFSGFGSFFRFAELPLLRLLGKRVIVVYLGSDARPPYLSGTYLDDRGGVFDPDFVAAEARRIARRFAWVEKYASVVVNHTGTAQFARKKFVRLGALRLPMSLRNSPATSQSASSANGGVPLRVLHAPSRPLGKGSPRVREMVDILKAEGFEIELIELKGVPNHEVLRQLGLCDLVVDELYSDLPMATFAAEASLFAKPVVVGSLYTSDFARDNPDLVPPTIFIDPEALVDTVRDLITNPEKRVAVGAAAKAFVAEQSTSAVVAQRYYQVAADEIPDAWISDPHQILYVGGWGLSKENWRAQLRRFIEAAGIQALQLDHRPDLQNVILQAIADKPRL